MIRRLIIAVVLIILLVIGLIVIERVQVPKEPTAKTSSPHAPVPEMKSLSESVAPAPQQQATAEPEAEPAVATNEAPPPAGGYQF